MIESIAIVVGLTVIFLLYRYRSPSVIDLARAALINAEAAKLDAETRRLEAETRRLTERA